MSTSGGIAGGGLMVARAHLNGAAISTMFSAPVTIIAAPGANKLANVVSIEYESVAGTSIWTMTSAGLFFAGHIVTNDDINRGISLLDLFNNMALDSQVVTGEGTSALTILTASAANKAVVVAMSDADPLRGAPIVTAVLNSGGTGYVIGDTGTIMTQSLTGGATYVVDTVAAITGAVLTFHLTAAGTGYNTANNDVGTTPGGAQPGIGSGFNVNITAISPATGDLYVTVYYTIIDTH